MSRDTNEEISDLEDDGLWIDEEPLRAWILKSHHEKRYDDGDAPALLKAVTHMLSGPPGGPSAPGQYYFLVDPETSLPAFAGRLDAVAEGLGRSVFAPLLAAVEEKEKAKEGELAPNLSLYVASLAGPVALKNEVDETIVCALLSATLLTVARLGRKKVEALVANV